MEFHNEDVLNNAEFKSKVFTILMVDDDEDQLLYFKTILHAEGFRVFTAGTPREGLQLMRTVYFDVIISDFKMPGADGGEFIKHLRSTRTIPDGASFPIILLTNSVQIDENIAISLGANHFCDKKDARTRLSGMIKSLIIEQERQKQSVC